MPNHVDAASEFDSVKNSGGAKTVLIKTLVFILTLAIVIPIAIHTVPDGFKTDASPFLVSGRSMEPTLTDGQQIMINNIPERPENGSIIVCLLPEQGYQFTSDKGKQYIVKRIIAGPGETVEIGTDDTITVDGVMIEEPYLIEAAKGETYIPNYPNRWELGDGEYFVAGDNRGHSCDSRYFGVVRHDEITGIVDENAPGLLDIAIGIVKYIAGLAVLYLLLKNILTTLLRRILNV